VITTARHPAFVAHGRQFDEVAGDSPALSLFAAVDAHEGPVYFADEDALYFTTLPRPAADRTPSVQIKRLALDDPDAVSVLVAEANGANGMAPDRDGRLVVCEQGSRWAPARISRLDRTTGDRTAVVEDWRGLPLNSPNDVVVAGDGAIWFTDPSYGHLQGFRPEPAVGDFVYRHDPDTGQTVVVADGFDKPNGIAFSPRRADPVCD
jgi:gluconolactonase